MRQMSDDEVKFDRKYMNLLCVLGYVVYDSEYYNLCVTGK